MEDENKGVNGQAQQEKVDSPVKDHEEPVVLS